MERNEVIVSEQELARQKEFTRKMREMNDRRTRTPLALVDTFGCQQNVACLLYTSEYDVSDTFRTLDTNCNMIRVGDEMARTLTECGISVVHDRSLYDYPSYSGAYNRSLASIERYLEKYPSISFVLDVHRDAVQDANGNQFKLLCGEDAGAAQLEFVIGSNGGGLSHDLWRENLKLACAVPRCV